MLAAQARRTHNTLVTRDRHLRSFLGSGALEA
jgi:hypothetical protein